MKIIDLLNKIANGEEVPNKIRIGIHQFYKTKKATLREDYDYQTEDGEYLVDYLSEYEYITKYLTNEIEIIEEDDEYEPFEEDIEELTYENTFKGNSDMEVQEVLVNKMNEIIKKVNKLKKEMK